MKTHPPLQSFGQIELLNGSTAAFSAVTRGVTRLIILDAEFLPKDALSQVRHPLYSSYTSILGDV